MSSNCYNSQNSFCKVSHEFRLQLLRKHQVTIFKPSDFMDSAVLYIGEADDYALDFQISNSGSAT